MFVIGIFVDNFEKVTTLDYKEIIGFHGTTKDLIQNEWRKSHRIKEGGMGGGGG